MKISNNHAIKGTQYCSLSSEEIRERKLIVRNQLIPNILKQNKVENGIEFSFKENENNRRLVDEFVEYESQCCNFLNFSISKKDRYEFVLKIMSSENTSVNFESFNFEHCLQMDPGQTEINSVNLKRTGIITITLGLLGCMTCLLPVFLAVLGIGGAGFITGLVDISPIMEGVGIALILIGVIIIGISYQHRKNSNKECCS